MATYTTAAGPAVAPNPSSSPGGRGPTGGGGRMAVVGMVHLRPLPGSPGFDGDWPGLLAAAGRDAEALVSGGVDAVMVENFGDVPFFKDRVPVETVAHLTAAAAEVVRRVGGRVPVGVNCLRNDGLAAVAIAAAVGASFVRVNVLCGARVTDQGVIEGRAAELARLRRSLGANVRVWADVDVKHSAPLGERRPVEEEVADLVARGGAEALIVSGSGTGRPTDPAMAGRVRAVAGGVPVYVGSGATAEGVRSFAGAADGFIVGTALKAGGRVAEAVDVARVRAFVAAARGSAG